VSRARRGELTPINGANNCKWHTASRRQGGLGAKRKMRARRVNEQMTGLAVMAAPSPRTL